MTLSHFKHTTLALIMLGIVLLSSASHLMAQQSSAWHISLQGSVNAPLDRPDAPKGFFDYPPLLGVFPVPPYGGLHATAWYDLGDHFSIAGELGVSLTRTPLHYVANYYLENRDRFMPRPDDYSMVFYEETLVPVSLGMRYQWGWFYAGLDGTAYTRFGTKKSMLFNFPDRPAEERGRYVDVLWALSGAVGVLIPLSERLDVDVQVRYSHFFPFALRFPLHPMDPESRELFSTGMLRISAGLRYRL